MILQTTVERWANAKVWQSWGVMELEVKADYRVYDTTLSGTLRSYLSMGRSPLGYYRVGHDDYLGIFVYEKTPHGELKARPITAGECEALGFRPHIAATNTEDAKRG